MNLFNLSNHLNLSSGPAALLSSKTRGCRWRGGILCLLALAAPVAIAATLNIGGTGTGAGIIRLLAEGFARVAPGVTVVVVPNLGTGEGLRAVAAGAIHAAVVSRPLTTDEDANGLVALEYGKTPFVFATAVSNAGGFKTVAELAEVDAGRRQTWPDGTPIRLIMRPKNDGDTLLLESVSPAMKQAVQSAMAQPGMVVSATDQDAADAMEMTPGALGTSSLALISSEGHTLHMLPVNGVAPSPKTIADVTYPFVKTLFLVRKIGADDGVMRFFDFVASSARRQILLNLGYWVPAGK